MSTAAPQAHRGEKLGLPADGRGSLASPGSRVGALVVDCIASGLVAALGVAMFHHGGDTASRLPGSWSLVPFALDYVVGLLVAGRTLGMNLVGIRVIRVDAPADRPKAVDPWRALLRTFLLMLLVPAVVWDKDGRGLHDRLTDTAVVRA
jgi:uncharacterized RDD family membrane protein YckC